MAGYNEEILDALNDLREVLRGYVGMVYGEEISFRHEDDADHIDAIQEITSIIKDLG